ncbi:YihY/virulence factor BrkB family protein [Spirosoma sp. KNUC1025]|uniref:YihY/virulence factor BrkB family protein n=1 Tax=Spirosoma sp. KNUC1025 TaxID=2894082 RepID=UPI0038653914|nr:YihY/virulence factor BrkB family protein [Spirosoma sp. KNUC1025]
MRKVVPVFQLASRAFANLKSNDPIRMAAATAFFSFFALPPIVIILSQLYGNLLSDDQRVSRQLFHELAQLFGHQSARQLKDISQRLQQPQSSTLLTILSLFLLLLASTTLFAIVKNSLNQLWSVKTSSRRRFWYVAVDKLIALGIIIFSGFLFMTSLTISRTLAPLNNQLFNNAVGYDWSGSIGQHLLSVVVLTIWFAVVFKYLPDIRIRWQAVWVGALVTGLLVEAGEEVLDRLLIRSPVRALYGTSGAIILVLLFVFYASLIFYYGASFTRYYAEWIHLDAKPSTNAVAYQIKEVEREEPKSVD